MSDDLYAVHDTRLAAIDRVLVAAGRAVHHWNEFGPEAEFTRKIDDLEAALKQWNRFWGQEQG
ncbi:MAG TPA: hypothetical protein VI542_07415 [Candidatus Tectomicrobia bacterium]